jgi:hypothetical protein
LITAGFCNLCIAASLAEFISAYPTYVYGSITFWRSRYLIFGTGLVDNITGLLVSFGLDAVNKTN